MRLLCGGCGNEHQVDKWNGALWSLCADCDELARQWAAESKRDKRALAEEALASPRYSCLRALLTYEPARLAARVEGSAD